MAIFGKNWLFWEFLTYNFQTQLWIFLIFGIELLWILTLSGEPIILCLVLTLFIFFTNRWMNLKFWHQIFWPILNPFLVRKLPFLHPNKVFGHLLVSRLQPLRPMDSCLCDHPFMHWHVCYSISRKPRIIFFCIPWWGQNNLPS